MNQHRGRHAPHSPHARAAGNVMSMMSNPGRGAASASFALRAALTELTDLDVETFLACSVESRRALSQKAEITLDKPYGRNHILMINERCGISFACLEPDRSTSFHYHDHRREFFLVRQGRLRLVTPDGERILNPGEWACSTPGVPHSIANGGDGVLEIIEIFAPPLLDDKVRISDPYDRGLGKARFLE